jgi:hypothetical protein
MPDPLQPWFVCQQNNNQYPEYENCIIQQHTRKPKATMRPGKGSFEKREIRRKVVTEFQGQCDETVGSSCVCHMRTVTACLTQALHQSLCHAVCKEYGITTTPDRFIPEYTSGCENNDNLIQIQKTSKRYGFKRHFILHYNTNNSHWQLLP